MSYILSALKKVERKRQPSGSPDILSVQIEPMDEPRPRRWLSSVFIVSSILIVSALAVWYLTSQVAIFKNFPTLSMPTISFNTGTQTQSMPPRNQASAPPQTRTQPRIAPPEPTQVSAPQANTPSPIPQTAMMQEPTAPPPKQSLEQAVLNDPYLSALPQRGVVPMFDELSDDVRRQIPRFDISGYLYSSTRPQANKVIINGQALRAGQYVSDDLQLKEIHSDYIIMNYKSLAFRLNSDQF